MEESSAEDALRYAAALKELEDICREGLFGTLDEIAGFYHELYFLYLQAGMDDDAIEALRRAKEIAEEQPKDLAAYGAIFSDWAVYGRDPEESLEYIEKAISVYDSLRKNGAPYPVKDLAIALRNRGLLRAKAKEYESAGADVEQAILLWQELQRKQYSDEIRGRLEDARRLLDSIRQHAFG